MLLQEYQVNAESIDDDDGKNPSRSVDRVIEKSSGLASQPVPSIRILAATAAVRSITCCPDRREVILSRWQFHGEVTVRQLG